MSFLSDSDLLPRQLSYGETLPSSVYTHPDSHPLDKEAVFKTSWCWLGSDRDLEQPGSFFPTQIGRLPVLVVRDEDRQIRAFENICRHRAGPLALEPGCGKQLQCRYHGWTYRLDGMLKSAPELGPVEGFEREKLALFPIETAQWQGHLWGRVASGGADFSQWIEGLEAAIAPHRLSGKTFYRRVSYDIACNWKVYVDNYLEGYHLPFVHPTLSQVLDYKNYKTWIYPYFSLQDSPIDEQAGPYAAGRACYVFLHPNLMLNILPGRLQLNLVEPLAVDRCRIHFDYFYDHLERPEVREFAERDHQYSDQVQREDIEICERVQAGLSEGRYRTGRLSTLRETGVHHFQELVRAQYRAQRKADSLAT